MIDDADGGAGGTSKSRATDCVTTIRPSGGVGKSRAVGAMIAIRPSAKVNGLDTGMLGADGGVAEPCDVPNAGCGLAACTVCTTGKDGSGLRITSVLENESGLGISSGLEIGAPFFGTPGCTCVSEVAHVITLVKSEADTRFTSDDAPTTLGNADLCG